MRKYLQDKKIGKKLQVCFGAVIGIFLTTILAGIVGITLINQRMNNFYEVPYENSTLQMEIRKDTQYVGKQILWAMTTEDKEENQAHVDEAATYAVKVSENAQKLSENFDNKELMDKLLASTVKLKEVRARVVELTTANKNEEALAIYNTDYTDVINEVQDTLIEVGALSDEDAKDSYAAAARLGIIEIIIMIVMGIVCILFCVYVGILITKALEKPIQELEEGAKKLSKGELDAEITYVSQDELGSLAESFRTAFAFMKEVIEDTGYLLGELADGNLTVSSQKHEAYIGEFESILTSMRVMRDNFESTLAQIDDGSGQVASGATQMAESAQSLAEGATEQAGAIQELTATVDNVNTMAKESAASSDVAAADTRKAAAEAEEGKASMQELVGAMESISSVSLEIQNIISSIEDIASQTNLLSLNASIEAARAGEAGKGFAVVADQIGSLASDSAKSAVETKELIVKSLDEIQNGNAITRKTAEVFETIIDKMSQFAKVAEESSNSSNAQAEMLQEIQSGIEQVASVVQTNAAAAEQTSATSEELLAQSENLKSLVEQFQLRQ